MLKLYKLSATNKEYWETWDNDNGTRTVHWGILGTDGDQKSIESSNSQSATDIIQEEINTIASDGFSPISIEDHNVLLIEYKIDDMGSEQDLEKRYRLQDRMNETLGWKGLGHCDGGSIGNGTMEVCNFVVDSDVAKKVIEEDLKDTEFSNYTRIYLEG